MLILFNAFKIKQSVFSLVFICLQTKKNRGYCESLAPLFVLIR